MPPKKGKKNALTFYIETTLIPELQREGGYQFRNGIAALIPEASRRFKVNICCLHLQLYDRPNQVLFTITDISNLNC